MGSFTQLFVESFLALHQGVLEYLTWQYFPCCAAGMLSQYNTEIQAELWQVWPQAGPQGDSLGRCHVSVGCALSCW